MKKMKRSKKRFERNEDAEHLTRQAAIQTKSLNEKTRTVDVVFTTGAKVLRGFAGIEQWYEELSLSPDHVRLDRLNSGTAPLLDTHSAENIDSVIGVVESARLENRQGLARIRFAKDDKIAEKIWRKVIDGILKSVSIGYQVYESETVRGTENEKIPTLRAIDWEPYEISIVPIGADAGAKFRKGNRKMKKKKTLTPQGGSGSQSEAAEILGLCRTHNFDIEFAEELIGRELSLEDARAQILDQLVERNGPVSFGGVDSDYREPTDRVLPLMIEGLCARFGGKVTEASAEYRGVRTMDMARELLELRGISTRHESDTWIAKRSLGAHTTSDFPALLTETGNRFLRDAYETAQGGVRQIAKQTTTPDFRSINKLQLSEAPALKKVLESGEVTHGAMGESEESYSIATWGRIFTLSRQAIVNDDLMAFADFSTKQGRAAAEVINAELVKLLLSNPVMYDGDTLFHANHLNVGSGAVISIAALGDALKLMRLQKGLDGVTPINAIPKFLLVPATLEVIAKQYVAEITAADSAKVNPFSAQLEVVVDPRLDADSTTKWYVAADPYLVDTIEYAFLETAEGPQYEIRDGFDVLGAEMRVILDFGCGAIDWRGLVTDAGV